MKGNGVRGGEKMILDFFSNEKRQIFVVGYGSQGSAWSRILKADGWEVSLYLSSRERSFQQALRDGFQPRLLEELPGDLVSHGSKKSLGLVAFLCPDQVIGSVYRDYLSSVPTDLCLVLAHGYAVYAGELMCSRTNHYLALLAPKAIGPKLLKAGLKSKRGHASAGHELAAALCVPEGVESHVMDLALSLGFRTEKLIRTSFEKEAVADLISEQGLLCGGIFTLLKWTVEAMRKAGVSEALIREECLTELELIASLIRERGPASTFEKISDAAKAGTIAMGQVFDDSNLRPLFEKQVDEVISHRFVDYLRSKSWEKKAKEYQENLREIL